MSIGRVSRVFKFLLVAFVTAIFIIVATRQSISPTTQLREFEEKEQKSLLDSIRERIAGLEDEDVYKSTEAKDVQNAKVVEEEAKQEDEIVVAAAEEVELPFDDSMPGAYLKLLEPAPINSSYCKFNYDFPYDLNIESVATLDFPPQLGNSSQYRVLYNVVEAHNLSKIPSVTYATHMTANFAYFIPQLLRHWDGLITVAAFVPDLDSALFLEQINQYCYCEPAMHRVSIHLVTLQSMEFARKDINFDKPDNCIPQDSSKGSIIKDYDETIVYPVNVVRNVARTSALSKYVLLSDIELMPSRGLAAGFLKMLDNYNKTSTKEVYVLPIFEVEETEFVPDNKEDLLKLINAYKSVYFHELVCKHCQRFPGIDDWKNREFYDEIKPFKTVKRQEPYNRWEPIFIGTNAEPLYSEKLSWEGFQDKMTQSLEMCLQDYDYTILDNAFLCHWPGIKKKKQTEEQWRADFVKSNQKAYTEIVQNLLKEYKNIAGCKADHVPRSLP